MSEDRLQKILARAGFGSRRHAEQIIEEGRVTVNGRVATIGDKADLERDAVKVDGKRLLAKTAAHRYLLLNKPRAVMSTAADPEGRPTVLDLVPLGLRKALVPVGRLDFLTEGLMVLTDDGDFAQRVAHPRYGCTKTYEVKVRGLPDERSLEKLRRGIVLEGQRTRPASIDPRPSRADSDNTWWTVELGQGRTRQIREMFQRIGHPVMKLRRIAIGPVRDPDLPPGEIRELSEREVEMLRKAGKHRAKAEAAKAKAAREGTGRAKGGKGKAGKAGRTAKAGKGAKAGQAGKARKAGKPGAAGKSGAGPRGGRAGGATREASGLRTEAGSASSTAAPSRRRPGGGGPDRGASPRQAGADRRDAGEGAPTGAETGGDRRARRSPEGLHGRRAAGGPGGRSAGGGRRGGGGDAPRTGTSGVPSWFFGVAKPGRGSKTIGRSGPGPRDEAEGDRKPPAGRRSTTGEGPSGRPRGGSPRGAKSGGGARPGAGKPAGGSGTGKPAGRGPGGGKPVGKPRSRKPETGKRGGKSGGAKPGGSKGGGGRAGGARKGGSGGGEGRR